ncbi:MAG: DUF2269 domain-containing protein [Alicyclobacillus sp.]|nr:DUF2269 domain-containing protein [Alicyclobacillus sp.]
MKILVLIHVLSAIIGVGPTFFGHVLVRRKQTPEEYRGALKITTRLESFPKIGGSIAVLTGIALVVFGSYGSILQLWLIGALVLYVLVQIVVMTRVMPLSKRLIAWLNETANLHAEAFPAAQQQLVAAISNWYYVASFLGALLFVLMILKPE